MQFKPKYAILYLLPVNHNIMNTETHEEKYTAIVLEDGTRGRLLNKEEIEEVEGELKPVLDKFNVGLLPVIIPTGPSTTKAGIYMYKVLQPHAIEGSRIIDAETTDIVKEVEKENEQDQQAQ